MVKMWEGKQDPSYFLRLFQTDEGVELRIVDKSGAPVYAGGLLSINNEGLLCRHINIRVTLANAVGIQLDEEGKIKIRKW